MLLKPVVKDEETDGQDDETEKQVDEEYEELFENMETVSDTKKRKTGKPEKIKKKKKKC